MKKLDVPHFQQRIENDCMLACVKMVLDYYRIPVDYDAMLESFSFYEGGLSMPQIAMPLLASNLQAEIISLNAHLFNRHDIGKTGEALYQKIQSRSFNTDERKKLQQEYLDFIKAGGVLSAHIPTKEMLCQSIDENCPAIILTTTRLFHGYAPGYNFHGNVVYGYDDKHFYLHDPETPESGGGSHRIPQDLVLFAMHISNYADLDNGSILKVTP